MKQDEMELQEQADRERLLAMILGEPIKREELNSDEPRKKRFLPFPRMVSILFSETEEGAALKSKRENGEINTDDFRHEFIKLALKFKHLITY